MAALVSAAPQPSMTAGGRKALNSIHAWVVSAHLLVSNRRAEDIDKVSKR